MDTSNCKVLWAGTRGLAALLSFNRNGEISIESQSWNRLGENSYEDKSAIGALHQTIWEKRRTFDFPEE